MFLDGTNRREVDGRSLDGFSLFKQGIRPEWEDVSNRVGSELTCRKAMSLDLVDLWWENLVFALIGETIDENDEICGCRVVDKSKKGSKPMFRIELWLRSGNAEVAERIKTRMTDALVFGTRLRPPEFDFKKRVP